MFNLSGGKNFIGKREKLIANTCINMCLDAEAAAAALMQSSRTPAAPTTGVDGVGESLSVGTKPITTRKRRATIPLSSRRCVFFC